MTAAAINLQMSMKQLNMGVGENKKPEYTKINPQQTVPAIVDGDFILTESRAICIYLIEKYGKDDSLYPEDVKTRAVINQRLYFDMGTLFKQYVDHYYAKWFGKEMNPENLKKLEGSMAILDKFLEPTGFAAGTKSFTVADLVLFSTVSTFEAVNFDFSPYPNVRTWLDLMKKTAPGREFNAEGVELMRGYFKAY